MCRSVEKQDNLRLHPVKDASPQVGCKKFDIPIKLFAFQNFPQGININRKHDCQFKRTPQVFNPLRGWG
jgi:hypothetical protein